MTNSTQNDSFIGGLELCKRFYWDAIRPILDNHFPELRYTAGLVGNGSDVLGFDTEMSTDHDWGPRAIIFLDKPDYLAHREALHNKLAHELPYTFAGYSTHFSPPDLNDNGSQTGLAIDNGPINHRIRIVTAGQFIWQQLHFDIEQPLGLLDWLTFSEQSLLSVTAGELYHDGLDITEIQNRFSYYPHDVWLYQLAAMWARIGEEEHLMGRAGIAGDEVGSALIGGRLVRDIMRLSFLMERKYAPYPKWFGSAFRQLDDGKILYPILQQVLQTADWESRQTALVQAYKIIAQKHNRLGLTKRMPEEPKQFFTRPFQVIAFNGYDGELIKLIKDPYLKKLAEKPLIGGLDHISDSTAFLSHGRWRENLKQLYQDHVNS